MPFLFSPTVLFFATLLPSCPAVPGHKNSFPLPQSHWWAESAGRGVLEPLPWAWRFITSSLPRGGNSGGELEPGAWGGGGVGYTTDSAGRGAGSPTAASAAPSVPDDSAAFFSSLAASLVAPSDIPWALTAREVAEEALRREVAKWLTGNPDAGKVTDEGAYGVWLPRGGEEGVEGLGRWRDEETRKIRRAEVREKRLVVGPQSLLLPLLLCPLYLPRSRLPLRYGDLPIFTLFPPLFFLCIPPKRREKPATRPSPPPPSPRCPLPSSASHPASPQQMPLRKLQKASVVSRSALTLMEAKA